MARHQVGVVNISLVGPANATLGRAVAAVVARGYLLVAAVGNDGPAAPPLYPASYPGVVAVAAVDRQGRSLPDRRGPAGRELAAAGPGGGAGGGMQPPVVRGSLLEQRPLRAPRIDKADTAALIPPAHVHMGI